MLDVMISVWYNMTELAGPNRLVDERSRSYGPSSKKLVNFKVDLYGGLVEIQRCNPVRHGGDKKLVPVRRFPNRRSGVRFPDRAGPGDRDAGPSHEDSPGARLL